jgi:micrococcal nuclease
MQFLSSLLLFIHILVQTSITGKVVYVSDGDTFDLVTLTGNKVKIRVEGVDTPEMLQEFGLEAKEFVVKEILNKIVRLEVVNTDRYGRLVAKVYYEGKELRHELIRNGFAWHYKAYNRDRELAELEIMAKKENKGLWAKENPMPPWEFRKFGRRGPPLRNLSQNPAIITPGEMVLVCNSSGSVAYHNRICRGLNQCKSGITSIAIETARAAGRKPCGYCWPYIQ